MQDLELCKLKLEFCRQHLKPERFMEATARLRRHIVLLEQCLAMV